jgi:hypothetical protein
MVEKVFKTDWLASRPVFYNEKTLKISHNINDVIDFSNLEFHSEGFNNYLDFGYSVFGQTPVKYVKFLRHSSEIFVKNGKLKIIEHLDPVKKWFDEHPNYSDENEVLNLIKKKINDFEKNTKGIITLPLSGGFDSRLLAYFIEDKSRIKAFTYGVSENQEDSFEVVYARKIAKLLNIKWEQVELGDYHNYFDLWDQLFGISTHAHGMYHIEAYNKILGRESPNLFLSGIIGDAWSGNVKIPEIKNIESIIFLGYTHGMNADASFSKFRSNYRKNKLGYLARNKLKLKDEKIRTVESMRMKLTLLNYLVRLPSEMGFRVYSPFLDVDVALGMLNLPPDRKKDRQWQKDFFKKAGLDVENMGIKKPNKKNTLNNQAMRRVSLKPLDKKELSALVDLDYIDWVNENVRNTLFNDFWSCLLKARYIGGGLKLLGFEDTKLKAYSAYLTLKPIENILHKKKK